MNLSKTEVNGHSNKGYAGSQVSLGTSDNMDKWVKWRMGQNELHINHLLVGDKKSNLPVIEKNTPIFTVDSQSQLTTDYQVYGIPRAQRKGSKSSKSETMESAADQSKISKKPLRYCTWLTNRPKTIMGIGFAFHMLMLVSTGVLMVLKDKINFELIPIDFSGLPLILQKDVDYLRNTAWVNRNNDSAILKRGQGIGIERERSQVGTAFLLIYETTASVNVFTQKYLAMIEEVEDTFTSSKVFQTSFCMADPTTTNCSKPQSIVRFFDGTYKKFDPIFDDPNFENIYGVLSKAKSHPKTTKLFQYFLANDFLMDDAAKTVFSRIMRTNIFTGLPLKGFVNATDREEEQNKRVEEFFVNNYKNLADATAKKYKDQGLEVLYFSQPLLANYIQSQVIFDMLLAVASLGFIFLIVLIQTQSLWVTGFSVFSIITSFLVTNFVYRVVLDYQYFGIFHVLAIFIILGIGADNIFILFDTWKIEGLRDHPTTAHRLSVTYGKAAKAMFFTSLTTAMAFFVSAMSPLISVSAFGVFSGLLIIFNYINVIVYIPAVIMVYHRHFENWVWPFCRPCIKKPQEKPSSLPNLLPSTQSVQHIITTSSSEQLASTQSVQQIITTSSSEQDGSLTSNQLKERRLVVRFFRGPFFKLVTHRVGKWVILFLVLGFAGGCAYMASKLEVNEEEIQFLPEDTNFGKFLKYRNTKFQSSDDKRTAKIYLVWGLKKQDRSECHHNLYKCIGSTVWDNNFDINKPGVQEAFMRFCTTLKSLPTSKAEQLRIRRDAVSQELEIECFIDEYNSFLKREQNLTSSPVSLDVPVNMSGSLQIMKAYPLIYNSSSFPLTYSRPFELPLSLWLCDKYKGGRCMRSDAFNVFDPLLGEAEDEYSREITNVTGIKYGTRLRYAAIKVSTTMVVSTTGYTPGLKVRDAWEDYINEQKKSMPEPMQGVYQTTFSWNWMKVKKALANSAYMGIIIGLSVALPVLLLATMNLVVGLMAFLSLCCVIAAVIATMVLAGWKLGVLESINLILVVGLSVDYIVHLAEGYSRSEKLNHVDRVRDTLEEVGISVLSGALTTLGASFFMLFAEILFFQLFALFIFSTIGFSLFFALTLFIPIMSTMGPSNECGSILAMLRKCFGCCCRKR